jgi:hypothetical protein
MRWRVGGREHRGGHDPDTVPMARAYEDGDHRHRGPMPYGPEEGPRSAESQDSYLTWLALGLVSPFLLAAALYPLVWLPVSAVGVPLAGAIWAVLAAVLGIFGFRGASRYGSPDGAGSAASGSEFWDFGPLVSPQVALTFAVAVLAAWFVLSGVVGKRRWWHAEGPAKRGFRTGLRVALLAGFLIAVWWANRTLAGA